jgi:exodeoxyribonuclease III
LRYKAAVGMLKVTTWNVNGIRARAREVLEWVERERPDVLCLQEVKAAREQIPEELCELSGYHCYWHGYKGYSGVGLHLSRATFPQAPLYGHSAFDHESRIVTARWADWLFASIYVPNGGKDFPAKVRFLDALDEWTLEAERAGTHLVLCGDLNVAREMRDVHPKLQDVRQIGQTPAEQAQLERIIGRRLVDIARKFRPEDDRLYTWWAPWRNMREKNIGWRLDYVLSHEALAARATDCWVAREFGTSDHAPVTATFDLEPPPLPPEQNVPVPPAPPPKGQLKLF